MKATTHIYSTVCMISASLLWVTLPASAIEVGWHDLMYLQVGDGVDLIRQDQPKAPGLVMCGPLATTNLNTGWQSEAITYAQHTYDMVKTLSVNSSVSLDSLISSGDIGVSFFGEQTFDANDLHFVFTKTRDFGTMVYAPMDFSPTNKSLIAGYEANWQGEGLHSKITSALGTHYVAGVEKAAMISVAYTFHFDSASIKQLFSVSASGSVFDSASFSGLVSSFFASSDTSRTLSYQFYSSDPNQSPTNFNFGWFGNITSFQGFTNLVSQLEAYANSMDPAHAKVTGYILNPIQTVPGYLSLLGGYVPLPDVPDDYSDFLQAYASLQVWRQRLDNRGLMGWLNTKGQQVVSSNALDVANDLAALKTIATDHFNTGAPLYVPPDVVAFLANLSDLRLPEIYAMDTWRYLYLYDGVSTYYWHHALIGRIDCGKSDLIAPVPFAKVWVTNSTAPASVYAYYIPSDFETNMLNSHKSASINEHLKSLFASEQWNTITNANPDLNGFFLIDEPDGATDGATGPNKASDYAVQILDGTTVIDVMPFLDSRSGGCLIPSQFSNLVNVCVTSVSAPGNGPVGVEQPFTVQVTNQSPAQAYGTTVSFAVGDAFDFASADGSQGSGSFDPASRTVSYAVGPMLPGAAANISLHLIPIRTGAAVPSSSPQVTVSAGLTNAGSSTASFSPVTSFAPALGLTRTPSGLQLDWWSDTDRLHLENSPLVGPGGSWYVMPSDGLVANGSHRFLATSATGSQGYFRLHGQ